MLGTFRRSASVIFLAGAAMAAQMTFAPPGQAVAPRTPDAAVVTSWNAIALRTVFTENSTAIPVSGLYFAFVSLAVNDAVLGAERGGPPIHPHRGRHLASSEVAAATAAYRVLRNYFPASAAHLDVDYNAFLSGRPAGSATNEGKRIGEAAAAARIASRVNDGRDAPRTLDVVPAPGVWRPTPPALAPMLAPWLGFVKPLTLRSPTQFALPGPDALTSAAYARDFQEVKLYGAKNGSLRSPAQSETALFWNANSVLQYRVALADQVTRRGYDIVRAARAFAALDTSVGDALVACWRAKYDYAFWRPVTAIPLAATDGNPATTADPAWEPFSPTSTPPYPEYVSGHACITGAASNVFSALFGARKINLDVSSSVTGTSRHYDSAAALDRETMNARIWLGLHFRRAMIDGNRLGHQASDWALAHLLRGGCRR